MQVFKLIIRLMLSKKGTILMYLGIFLTLTIVLTNNGDTTKSFTTSKMDICIFDEDDTAESRALAELLTKNNKTVKVKNNKDAIIDALYYESADFILVIEDGYSEKLKAGETEDLFSTYRMHESYAAVRMEQYLDEYVSSVNAMQITGISTDEATEKTAELMSEETEVNMSQSEKKSWYGNKYTFYWRYIPYISISIIVTVLGMVLMVMNRKEIRQRINSSCMRSMSYSMQVLAASMVFVLGLWLIFIAFGFILCGGLSGIQWLGLLNILIFLVISALLASLLSAFGLSENLLNLMTQVLGLGMSFLCGGFIDPSLLSDEVIAVSKFLPAYWNIRVSDMLIGGVKCTASGLLTAFAMQGLFIIMLTALTILVNKTRHSSAALKKTAVA